MRRITGALAFAAGAALIIGSTGAAIGQEEDPPPDAATTSETTMVEPSTLEIMDIAGAKAAGNPLKGKKLKKAVAKAAPDAARYVVNGLGDDAIERLVEMSLLARSLDEAGDTKTAKAVLAVATLLYRNAWSQAKTDPVAFNSEIEAFIEAGAYGDLNPALILFSEGQDGFGDICLGKDWAWFYGPGTPSLCADDTDGRMVRADYTFIDESAGNGSRELFTGDPAAADAGGLGIHKIIQHKTANDKLAGKKYRKALANALNKHGAAIAGYESSQRGLIEMVLAARAADEAGNPKAAESYMNLALAAYRSGQQGPNEDYAWDPDYNQSIAQLISEEYDGLPGLELYPPEGMVDACFDRKGKFMTCVDPTSPFECYLVGGSRLERVTLEDVNDCAG